MIEQQVYVCFSFGQNTFATIWIVLIVVYTALLQIVGLILAFQTRKVKIKQLHDSKYIAGMIYASAISLVINAIAIAIDGSLLNTVETLFSGSLLAATTVFLALAFIPTVNPIELLRLPVQYFLDHCRWSVCTETRQGSLLWVRGGTQ